jgi:hypothetical protein
MSHILDHPGWVVRGPGSGIRDPIRVHPCFSVANRFRVYPCFSVANRFRVYPCFSVARVRGQG